MVNVLIEVFQVAYQNGQIRQSAPTREPMGDHVPGLVLLNAYKDYPQDAVVLSYIERADEIEHFLVVNRVSIDQKIRELYRSRPDPMRFLPTEFFMRDLQKLHEAVFGVELQKDTFRRSMLPYLEGTGRKAQPAIGRPAELYRVG